MKKNITLILLFISIYNFGQNEVDSLINIESSKKTEIKTEIKKEKGKTQKLSIEQLPLKEILVLILGSISTFLIWRVQYQKEKIKNIESQLSEKKYQMYSELIYLLFDITNGSKIGKKVSERDLMKRLFSIKRDMFIYATDEIFNKFKDWTLEIGDGSGATTHMKTYFELMKLARKDMGQNKTKLTLDDFMLFYMQDKEEYKKFKKENNW
ncbi:hypothetical protein [Tenacibaculum ovolyticum]|uniref:hypothetical protein n=1 Tax=Tenacibaculum ovolyticum TaxID=104270 RepID=UPI003BA86583